MIIGHILLWFGTFVTSRAILGNLTKIGYWDFLSVYSVLFILSYVLFSRSRILENNLDSRIFGIIGSFIMADLISFVLVNYTPMYVIGILLSDAIGSVIIHLTSLLIFTISVLIAFDLFSCFRIRLK